MPTLAQDPGLRLRCAQNAQGQAQSPLFSALPSELRYDILSLALHHFDTANPYPLNSYYRRPDFDYPERFSPAVLRTCRRIYAEMGYVVHTNEYLLWGGRAPRGACSSAEKIFGPMDANERLNVRFVHFFTQVHYLEGIFPADCEEMGNMGLGIRSLKITIRQSDWYGWRTNAPPWLQSGWGRALHHLKVLKSLDIEMEVIQRDFDDLQILIDLMLGWTYDLASGQVLSTEGQEVSTREWVGPSEYEDGMAYNFLSQRWEPRYAIWDDVTWAEDEDPDEDSDEETEYDQVRGGLRIGDRGDENQLDEATQHAGSTRKEEERGDEISDDGVGPSNSADTLARVSLASDASKQSGDAAPVLVYCIKTLKWRTV